MADLNNLVKGLTDEILRVTEIIKVYESLEGGVGMFAAAIMKREVEMARQMDGKNGRS